MRTVSRKIWPIILLLLVLILGSILGNAQEQVTVTLSFANLAMGESSVVQGEIDCDGGGCSAFAITISFDPVVLQVDSAEVGPVPGR